MRKLLIALAVLLVLLGVADRVAVQVASKAVAKELRTTGQLRTDPKVTIGGFPFLTQALQGRYDRIEVDAGSVTRGDLRLSSFDAVLTGVHVPLSKALSGSVTAVPVEGLTATVVVSYADLAAAARLQGLAITPKGSDQLQLSATVRGQQVSADATVRLEGDDVVVVPAGSAPLGFRASVGSLPYGLRLQGVTVTPGGLRLAASSGPTVLSR